MPDPTEEPTQASPRLERTRPGTQDPTQDSTVVDTRASRADSQAATSLQSGSSTEATADVVAARVRQAVERQRARVRVDPFVGANIHGRFLIEEKIGEGGMGAVYRGVQTSVHRPVAIKILLRNLVQDEQFVRRFQNEALAVSRLSHPNAVRIYDFGQYDEATLYIAMEMLEGEPLSKTLRREGALPVRRALHIVEQVANCLAEAHAKGIVHRDLKPDNLFVVPTPGDPWFIKVLDFGVAKFTGEGSEGTLTQTHAILGTPKYMAPEQALARPVDARTDLYALGVIAYEMLTGKPPFEGKPLVVLQAQVSKPPPPLPERAPGLVIPADVQRLVMRLLEKDPARRPQSASELASEAHALIQALPEAFDEVVSSEDHPELVESFGATPTVAGPLGTDEATDIIEPETAALARPAPRRRIAAWLAAAVLVAGGAGVVWWQMRPMQRPVAPQLPARAWATPGIALSQPAHEAVRVVLKTEPAHARLAGPAGLEGTAPLAIERWRNDVPVRLVVDFGKRGKVPVDVTFETSRELVVRAPQSQAAQPAPPPSGRPAAGAGHGGAQAKTPRHSSGRHSATSPRATPKRPPSGKLRPTQKGTGGKVAPPSDDGRIPLLKR